MYPYNSLTGLGENYPVKNDNYLLTINGYCRCLLIKQRKAHLIIHYTLYTQFIPTIRTITAIFMFSQLLD